MGSKVVCQDCVGVIEITKGSLGVISTQK